ncbi:MAG: helix-turn-helix domain-containing protein [Pyrinomonadaceae bacterium]
MSSEKKHELIFKALADGRRRKILDLLKPDAMSTGDICDHFKTLDRCTVMQHLNVLEKADLIIVRRIGRVRWNYLNAVPIREIYTRWISQYADPSVELLARLKGDLEGAGTRLPD